MKKKTLYKYFSGSRNFFENRRIRFSPRAALNDPFEIRPSVKSMAMFLHSDDSFCDDGYDAILKRVKDDQENYFDDDNGIPMLNQLGVLCLTESKRNLLMWSHYANSHKGYVVGFDVSHDFFNNYRRTNFWREYENIGKVLPVKYESYRTESVYCFTEWYFHKSDDWIYEKEHRLVLPLVSCDLVIEQTPDSGELKEIRDQKEISGIYNLGQSQYLCLSEVPKEAIVSVTFGAAISQELEGGIRDSVIGLNPFTIEKAKYSEMRFELELEET
jgi:hypothetical protein